MKKKIGIGILIKLDTNNISLINKFFFTNNIKFTKINNWYQSNLSSLDKYIATTKVCDDTAYTGKDEYIFAVSQRLSINH